MDEINKALEQNVEKLISPLKEKDLSRKEIPTTPHVPIRPGTNRDQPLELLQKNAYWNNELVVVTSCLVEQQFLDAYREKILCFSKAFENLFHSRDKLRNLSLKTAMIKEKCESLATAETNLKEKDALYENHLKNVNDALDDLSKERNALTKK
ncbi:hypothetical protein PIB30_040046 [Stylosanthes scabra]|uniref:Uncharacterized protein n=1 Tax=Stylosanthes scabra TaxID=79078 RepID=A0ABU6TER6_9FABA|nr:hypothetical protein [Stylosanthes scabra]